MAKYKTREEVEAEDALIWKRMDEGLRPMVIARRLGVEYKHVERSLNRRKEMASKNNKTVRSEAAKDGDLQEKFEAVREAIRERVKSGLQTHEAQDSVMAILRLLDDCEAETKVLALAVKDDGYDTRTFTTD